MKKIKIGFPDGNGVLGGIDFWNRYTNILTLTMRHPTRLYPEQRLPTMV